MDKSKLLAVLSAAKGLNYAEWRLIAEEIEHGFQMQMNRQVMSDEESARIRARLDIELEAYFRR